MRVRDWGAAGMGSFRFLHAADLHLDCPLRGVGRLPDQLRQRWADASLRALDNLVACAIESRVRFIVLSGDLYERADRSLRAQLRFHQAMKQLADRGIGVFVVHGNHDPLTGNTAVIDWPEQVRIFGTDQVETHYVYDEAGQAVAAVSGISYGQSAVTSNLVLLYPERGSHQGLFRIGVLHANLDGASGHGRYSPCTRSDLAGKGIDYWALGHVHARAVLHSSPWIVYPGNTQGRMITETGPRGCYVVEVQDGVAMQPQFRELDVVRWFDEQVDIEQAADAASLRELLQDELESIRRRAAGRDAIVRLTLVGRTSLHKLLARGSIAAELAESLREREREMGGRNASAVWVNEIDVSLAKADDGREWTERLGEEGFAGDVLRKAAALAEGADEEALRAFCEAAAAPLLSNARLARWVLETSEAERRRWMREAARMAAELLAADGDGRGAE